VSKISITIEIDDGNLARCSDEYLALYWHVAQANPAGHGDREAGELAERIGREIIRRWLRAVSPEMWHHQGRDYYWAELCKLGKWNAERVFVPDPQLLAEAQAANADLEAGS
jgi:hypothetical protein